MKYFAVTRRFFEMITGKRYVQMYLVRAYNRKEVRTIEQEKYSDSIIKIQEVKYER
jgi:hypothetical protein